MQLRIIDDKRQIVAEGPLWDDEKQLLYTVDILGRTVRTTNLDTLEHTEVSYPQEIGCIALKKDGGLMAAMRDGIYDCLPDGTVRPVCIPEKLKGRRFNDGKVGPDGRFYVGTTDAAHKGAFYRLDPDGGFTELLSDIGCSNGLAWNSDCRTLYYVDSPERRIEAFDFDISSGSISNRRTVMECPSDVGEPDGMTIDSEDKLWLAVWGAHCFYRLDPEKKCVLETVCMPTEKVSCCGFAGKDMKTLVITTASKDISPESEPDAGMTFAAEPGVTGVKAWRFG